LLIASCAGQKRKEPGVTINVYMEREKFLLKGLSGQIPEWEPICMDSPPFFYSRKFIYRKGRKVEDSTVVGFDSCYPCAFPLFYF
jgi:hypothetical protein